jgi:hypothetical protein
MWQQLPTKAAGASLILAPLFGLVAVCAWPPLRADDRAQIAAIAVHPGRWYVFSLFILISSYLLVPAVLALMRVLRPSRPGWANLAGSVALLGVLVSIGDSATELVYWQMAARGASLNQMAALAARYDAAPGISLIYMAGGLAVVCGMAFLSAGLWRSRAVPTWTAAGIIISTVVNVVGLSSADVPLTIASYALMLAALGRIAVIVLSGSHAEGTEVPPLPAHFPAGAPMHADRSVSAP